MTIDMLPYDHVEQLKCEKYNSVQSTFRGKPTVHICSHRQQKPQIRCRSLKIEGRFNDVKSTKTLRPIVNIC
jgi:hypothetical protein